MFLFLQDITDLVVMIAVTIEYLAMCFLIGFIASIKHRSGLGWFFVSLFFTPILGVLCLIAVGDGEKGQIEAMIETLEQEPNKQEIIKALRELRQEKVKQELGETIRKRSS